MNWENAMRRDLIVDEPRRVRDELVKKYGGLDGWIDHLQELQKTRGRQLQEQSGKEGKALNHRTRKQRSRWRSVGSA